jgi:hypothetical protein
MTEHRIGMQELTPLERHVRLRCREVAQKLLPANVAVDVALALAIVGLGVLIVIAPFSVPGRTPPM